MRKVKPREVLGFLKDTAGSQGGGRRGDMQLLPSATYHLPISHTGPPREGVIPPSSNSTLQDLLSTPQGSFSPWVTGKNPGLVLQGPASIIRGIRLRGSELAPPQLSDPPPTRSSPGHRGSTSTFERLAPFSSPPPSPIQITEGQASLGSVI